MTLLEILDTIWHFTFLGIFVLLFILLYRVDQFQRGWYNEDMDVYSSIEKSVDRIDRRLQISGCLLYSK